MKAVKLVHLHPVHVPDDPTGGTWEPGEVREVSDLDAVLFTAPFFKSRKLKRLHPTDVDPDAQVDTAEEVVPDNGGGDLPEDGTVSQ